MVVSIVFLVFAALFTFLGVLKGKKYTWVFSALRIVGIVLSAVLAMLLSTLVARFGAALVTDAVGDSLTGNMQGLLRELPSASFALTALIAMLAAPIFFWMMFPIVYNLLNIVLKLISRVLVKVLPQKVTAVGTPETKGKRVRNARLRAVGLNPIGMVLGGVCGLLLFCVSLVPLVGLTGTAYEIADAAIMASGEENVPAVVTEALDASRNNAGTVVVRTLGGRALYNGLTTYRADGQTVRLAQELKLVGTATGALANAKDKDVPRADAASAIRQIEPVLKETVLLPRVGAELVDAASANWVDGKPYHGISMPSPKGYEETVKAIVQTQQDATPETFCEDMGTVVHMVAYLVEQDAMDEIKGDAMALFGNQELTEHLLYELLENPRLYVTVGSAFDIGVDRLGENLHMQTTRDALYAELCRELTAAERLPVGATEEDEKRVRNGYQSVMETYGIYAEREVYARAAQASADKTVDMAAWFAAEGIVSAETMSQKSELVTSSELTITPVMVQNKEAEAKTLAHALATIVDVANQASSADMDVAVLIESLGPALDDLAATETVGREKSEKIFKATLQSQKVSEKIGFSVLEASDAADTINVNSQRSSYSVQMISLSQTVQVLRSAGTEDGEAAVEKLIQDLTPESASTLQTISTPSVMINHGVPEKSAEPVSDMVSDMFGNLSDAKEEKGMSDEQLQKETAAVNKMMTVTMNAGDSNGSVFGEGSITGSSADEFITDVLESEVVSETIMEQVYGDGDVAKNDPLLTERNMAENEEAELLAALNDKWTNATDEQKADTLFQKKIVSIAALMNITVEITENGVEKVA